MKKAIPTSAGLLFVIGLVVRLSAQGAPPAPALDYDVFKTKVQPILTAPRMGNARCSACHSRGAGGYLEPLAPGSTTHSEDQSRRNFDRVSRLVVRGHPLNSILLLHPLETEAGRTPQYAGA